MKLDRIIPLVGLLVLITYATGANNAQQLHSSDGTRRLLGTSEETCGAGNTSSRVLETFGYSFIILYVFYSFHIMCEDYFIHSMVAICDALHLSEDVAGATFLAAASSLPEMVSNADDAFFVQSHIGIGTIVGSAVFNILFGLAACCFVCPADHKINPQAVVRDLIYFTVSIVLVFVVFLDGLVFWYESLVLCITYIIYVIHLMNNDSILGLMGVVPQGQDDVLLPTDASDSISNSSNLDDSANLEMEEIKMDVEYSSSVKDMLPNDMLPSSSSSNYSVVSSSHDVLHEDEQEPVLSTVEHTQRPSGCARRIFHYIEMPLKILFAFTIMKCDTPQNKKRWPFTFITCILYFILLCYLMVYLGTALSCTTGMNATVMGFTLLAIGTSLPDCLGGLAAAKNGYVGMAISNALGSNTFDILAALGFPYFLFSAIKGKPVPVDERQLAVPCICMFLAGIMLMIVLLLTKWKLTKNGGYSLFIGYLGFLIYVIGFDEKE